MGSVFCSPARFHAYTSAELLPSEAYDFITGFVRHLPNVVDITVHADAIHVGCLSGEDTISVEALCQKISEGGIPTQTTDSIAKDLWAKMLYNCALNSLGAILNVAYGELGHRSSSRELCDTIIAEVFRVMSPLDMKPIGGQAKNTESSFTRLCFR